MIKTIDRVMQFIKHMGLSARQFDLSIGASNGYTLRMNKNKASIGSDVIETIVRTYPQLNLVWLITGEGTMIKSSHQTGKPIQELTAEQEQHIESIVEKKLQKAQELEYEQLLQRVMAEIEQRNKQ